MGEENNLNKKTVIETFSLEEENQLQPSVSVNSDGINSNGMVETNVDGSSVKERPRKNNGPKILILLLVLICFIGFGVYKYFSGNPTEIIKTVINNTYEDFSAALKKYGNTTANNNFDIFNDSFKLSGTLNFRNKDYKDLEKEKINFLVALDYKNKKAEMGATLDKNAKTLLDVNAIVKDDELYLISETLFKNKYDLGEYKFSSLFDFSALEGELNKQETLDVEDVDFIVRELKDALIDALDDEKMALSKETIDLNGKSIKTSKISYKLDYEALCRINNSLIDSISQNDAILEKFSKITGKNKTTLKEGLSQSRLDESDKENYPSVAFFSVYTTGLNHDVVRVCLTDGIDTMEVLINDDKVNLIYDEVSNKNKIEVQITSKDERYEIIVYDNNREVALFNIKEATADVFDMDYVYNYGDSDIKVRGKFTQKRTSDKVFEWNASFDMDFDGVKSYFGIDLTAKSERGVQVATQDLSGTIKSESLTNEDNQYMMQKLMTLQDSVLFKYFYELVDGNTNIG